MRLQIAKHHCHPGIAAILLLGALAVTQAIAYKVERVCAVSKDLNPQGETWQQAGCATLPGTKQRGCQGSTPKIGAPPKVVCRTVVRAARPGEDEAAAAAEKAKKPIPKKANTPH